MEVLFYPLIQHDYDTCVSKYDCICKYIPVDMEAVELWSKYIPMEADTNAIVKIIDDVYAGERYSENLLHLHNSIGFRIYIDRHQDNHYNI